MKFAASRIGPFLARNWGVLAVLLLGTAIQAFLITRPLDFLLTNLLPDDAFYYFEIARHVTLGHGATFDGINATNGYHPLWLLILAPVFALLSVGGTFDMAPIYAALGISFLFNIATGIGIALLVARITDSRPVRIFAQILWSLNPFVMYESLNGLETSLALLLLAYLLLLAPMLVRRDRTSGYLLLGLISGLMILARIDMVVYALALSLWILLVHGFRGIIPRALAFGAPVIALVGTWLASNLYGLGMLLTSASETNTMVNHALVFQDNGTGILVSIKAFAYMLLTHGEVVLTQTGAAWLVFLLSGIALVIAYRYFEHNGARHQVPSLLSICFMAFLALFFLNAGLRFTGRSWYFISVNLLLVCFAAWTLSRWLDSKGKGIVLSGLAALVLTSFCITWYTELWNRSFNQRAMYEMAVHMNEALPSDTKIGVFNAGIAGYFAEDLQVINLDGLVNNEAYLAMTDRQLWRYIESEDIKYIADFPLYISYRYRSFFGVEDPFEYLREVHSLASHESNGRGNEIVLYEITREKD